MSKTILSDLSMLLRVGLGECRDLTRLIGRVQARLI